MNHDTVTNERTRREIEDIRDKLRMQAERAEMIAKDLGHADIRQAAELAEHAATAAERALER
jgi:hypothetical protein